MMKKLSRSRSHQGIEALESRIAPAAVITFTDLDGHSVKVASSKGTLEQLQAAVGVADMGTATSLLSFDFTSSVFKGSDITVTAGADATDAIFTRVEFLNAAGVDLGKVTIDGELDRINAGDNNSATAGLKTLTVGTWGNGDAYDSVVVGAINTLTVMGDFNGAYLKVRGSDSEVPLPAGHLTDEQGKIGSLFIGGSLVGTDRLNGGHIWATGDITKITVVGSVTGFSAATPLATDHDFSGRIFSGGLITTLAVGTDAVAGKVKGGDGAFSGQIVGAIGITNTTVKGSIEGGFGLESGAIGTGGALTTIVVTGDLLGGDGDRSGTLLSKNTINSVKIGGNIQGGDGFNSGAIGTVLNIGTVVVTGDIIGGAGESSGQIVSQGKITSVTVHSIIGGSNFESGAVGSLKGLGTVLVTGDLVAGSGTRSGIISTEQQLSGLLPVTQINAPIGKVTVNGSIFGSPQTDSSSGYRAGSILSGGTLGPVVVKGSVFGGGNYQTGTIASTSSIASVTIGGFLQGGSGEYSGTVDAATTLGAVLIGDPASDTNVPPGFLPGVEGLDARSGGGIFGGSGYHSGAVIAGTLAKIEIFGDIEGGSNDLTGVIMTTGSGAAGKLGPVVIHGSIFGGSAGESAFDAEQSGAIISSGALTSVTLKSKGLSSAGLFGSGGNESGSIFSEGPMGAINIQGGISGGSGDGSGRVSSNSTIASVFVGNGVSGGDGDDSGAIQSSGKLGTVTIGGNLNAEVRDLAGGGGERSGSVISGGNITKVIVNGYVLGGDGAYSGTIETQSEGTGGDIGSVYIARSLVGGFGSTSSTGSGSIFSSGKLNSVVIGDVKDANTDNGGSVIGGIAYGSGTISSEGDMGPVKIKLNLTGGSGNECGKIASGGKIASLSVGSAALAGSIIGGTGNYDTTVESGNQQGQVFAQGSIGAVVIYGNLTGNTSDPTENGNSGRDSGQIRAASIASVTIHGSLNGGLGARSGGIVASGNIGPVVINGNLSGGNGFGSGFIAGEGNVASVKIIGLLQSGGGESSGVIAAGKTLGPVTVGFLSGNSGSHVRISAGNLITSVTVNEFSTYADILAGYATNGAAINPDAQIGAVKIGTGTGLGDVIATNIVAGLATGEDGQFGTSDDAVIFGSVSTPAHSKIASIIIKGSVNTSDSSNRYGFVSETVGALKIGSTTFALHSGALNDFYLPTSSLSDTYYGEAPNFA